MQRRNPPRPVNRKSRKQLLSEIPDLVSKILYQHHEDCSAYASNIIEEVIRETTLFESLKRIRREAYLEVTEWKLSSRMESVKEKYSPCTDFVDPGLLALDAIIEISSKTQRQSHRTNGRREGKYDKMKVSMPFVHALPKYDAWIPVKSNYWVGKELNLEPYMPFLGDQDQDCELAFEVFEDMTGGANKEIDLSDGEVTKEGKFRMPKDDVERVDYYSLAQLRWREGSRKAILAVVHQFIKFDDTMWRVLAIALGIKDVNRIKAIAKVAQKRRRDHVMRIQRRERQGEKLKAHNKAWKEGAGCDLVEKEEAERGTDFIKHFCLICHIFACPQHESFNLEPIIPIPDKRTVERELVLKTNNAKPCSKNCYMNKQRHAVDESDADWETEEILYMRECIAIFGLDACSLAVGVGSKSCRQVHEKLHDPMEADVAKQELDKSRRVRRLDGKQADGGGKGKTDKVAVESYDPNTIDQDFSPCYHKGACTEETCSCVKKAMHCEATCGCKCGRFVEGGATGGIVWEPSAAKGKKGAVRSCENRHYGCGCVNGPCTDSRCMCWEHNRACSPDFCDCDCVTLPYHAKMSNHKCRNMPANIAQHKRTFMGKSDVHGLGLFAGERFEKGDLVGMYNGQMVDTRLADVIGFLYDAMERTYIFNVTESLVIDGGLLGSKVKFVNHTKAGDQDNCGSRLVRVRGDAYVGLYCTRRVEAGEEFLFDYRFTGAVPSWAQHDAAPGARR
ncbi:unnamed protein product [Agarophyton chilense]